MRVDAGGDDGGGDFFTGLERDSRGASVFYDDAVDGGLRTNFHAGFACSGCNGVGNGAGAASAESPGAEGAIDFAHVMVQENVRGAGRADSEKGADDSGGGHGGFEDVGLKPLIEKIGN